jgi:hypothetical protein
MEIFGVRLISAEWCLLVCIAGVSKPEFDGGTACNATLTNRRIYDNGIRERLLCTDEGIASQLVAAGTSGNNIRYKRQGRFGLIPSEDSCPSLESHAEG